MRHSFVLALGMALGAAAISGCSSGGGGTATDAGDTAQADRATDAAGDAADGQDAGGDAAAEAAADIAADVQGEVAEDWSIDPGDDTFQAGVAVRESFSPIGMPTAGYGQMYGAEHPHSPFTSSFAASTIQHTPILAKALYLRRGADELLLVRLDKIGTTPQLLDELTRRLTKEMGREWDGKVLLASNHTHLGPGRLWEAWVGEFANFLFWPFYYNIYVESLLDASLAAFKDAEPAKLGYGRTECVECHHDRRCENPELLDSTLWVVKIERADGSLKAVLLNFAIHGTVFHWSDYVLSGDAPGMMEQKLQETFDHPVEVFMLQSWGGDVAPGDPQLPEEQPLSEAIPEKYNRTERIGFAAAKHVQELLADIETSADVKFGSITLRLPFDCTYMDYAEGEWQYPNGGMLCGTNQESYCWGEPHDPLTMMGCMPLTPEIKVDQITLSAAFIGNLFFSSMPGEPHTDWALEGVERVKAVTGYEDVVALGYTNDHWGYLMKAYDWKLGGYEPTVTAWGPQQGEFMLDLIEHVAHKLADPAFQVPYETRGMLPAPTFGGIGYKPMKSKTAAAAEKQPDAVVDPAQAAIFTWRGGDPWYSTPWVYLEEKDGDAWTPAQCHNQEQWSNRTYLMETRLEMVPTWNDDDESLTRDFLWTVTVPIRRNVPTPNVLEPDTYRFRVTGKLNSADGEQSYELFSDPFEIK